jgi:hypothetical protein
MRISSIGETRSRATRKSIFAHLLEALHRSRRRDATRVLRRYRHLIVGQEQIHPATPEPESRQTKMGSRNASANTPLVRADRKPGRDARDPVRVT